jgi:acetyl esterase/lipase
MRRRDSGGFTIRGRLRFAVALFVGTLAAVPSAHAAIPSSLKSSCTTQTPGGAYLFKLCNDGIPPSGGRTANPGAVNAVAVPAKYAATGGDDHTGLPAKAADAATMAGADANGDIALDVDISMPMTPAPLGGYPLLVFMHGCCSGDKTSWEATSFDAGGERWHYSNAWFAARGYVVVNYTARGFVNGENNGNKGSTGETQLDSRRFEINDFQYLAGLLADDSFFNVNPQRVVTTGGSYGGGFSWMALTDPIWSSPGGIPMKLAAVAPKYGWTDLVDSLVPTGRHSQDPGNLPAFDGSDSSSPLGIPKHSIVAALYDSGKTGIPPGSAHTTFPSYIDDSLACLNSNDPFESNPLCTSTIQNTLPSFIDDRSAYYQNDWFSKIASDPGYRIPIFSAATFSDPLFPPVEHRRMANRILSVVPGYPIQQYYGDYQHFVQNKPKEWGDICGANHHVCNFADYSGGDLNAAPSGLLRTGVTTRLNRFIDHYAQPSGNPSQPTPSFDVTASLQICPQNAPLEGVATDEPGQTFTAPTFEQLARVPFTIDMVGTQTTVSKATPNNHATNSEPVANFAANGGRCPVENTPAGSGVATYDSAALGESKTMIGATRVSIDYSATSTSGAFQLDARLYDLFPSGQAVMVDRGIRRVTDPSGTVTYELHGNGWRFHPGHKVRIEIAQDDGPYAKTSTVPSSATITGVTLEIPTRENAGYARPRGATPLRVPLAIAYDRCSSPNRDHGPPLAVGSCAPPHPSSDQLTVGTADANGQLPKFIGSVRYQTVPGDPITPADDADVKIETSLTDVRLQSNLSDYAGALQATETLRMTDRLNGFNEDESGTAEDVSFPVTIPCATTADTTVGSTCSVLTTADSVLTGSVREGKRSIWQLGAIQVFDGGPDGDPGTEPNHLFASQGIFVP